MAGVVFAGAPDVQASFGVSYTVAAMALFTIPSVVAMLVEPPLLLWVERWDRHRTVTAGTATMGAALCLVGLAPNAPLFALAMSLVFVGSGMAVALAETHLMDANPDRREQLMARLTLMGVLGDMCAPLALAGLSALSLGWRSASGLIGGGMLLYAALLAAKLGPVAIDDCDEDDEPEPTLRQTLRDALGNRQLLFWSVGSLLCSLLDEVFVAFCAAYLATHFGLEPGARGVALAGFMLGGFFGVLALERCLARGVDSNRLLLACSAGCALSFALWLASPSAGFSIAGLVFVGLFTAPLWPMTQSRAYAALPGRAVVVEAVAGLLAPLELAVPLVLGLVADRWGVQAALVLLLLQPVILFAMGDPIRSLRTPTP